MSTSDPIGLAAEVLSAFCELPALFEGLHATLKKLAGGVEIASAVVVPAAPAVSIRKSVTPDYLICLDDGKRFKSLRRHLATLGMTPEQYRAKWNLPSTYPMVAPNSTARRSAFAKNTGFGLREKPIAAPPASAAAIEAVTDTIEVIAPEPVSVDTIEVVRSSRRAAPSAKPKPRARGSRPRRRSR